MAGVWRLGKAAASKLNLTTVLGGTVAWTNPRTWVAGETVTAAQMNTHVRDNLKAVGDAWQAYTPTFTGTLGNGTLTGAYTHAGKLVIFRFTLTFGTTTTVGANWGIGIPVAAVTYTGEPGIGQAVGTDTSATAFRLAVLKVNSSQSVTFLQSDGTRFGAASPWTWANGDTVAAYGQYEAA